MLDPLTIMLMASAGLKFAKEAIPAIREALAAGNIPDDKQAAVRAEYESLRKQLGGEYTGPAWQLSGR